MEMHPHGVNPPKPLSRRSFLAAGARAAAFAGAVSVFPMVSRGRVLGANDRIGVGFIGVGGRGSSHIGTVQKLMRAGENLRIVAVGDVFPMQKGDATAAHWQNFLQCARTREKPVSDVEFGLPVQAALNMALLSLLNDKVVKFDSAKNEIIM